MFVGHYGVSFAAKKPTRRSRSGCCSSPSSCSTSSGRPSCSSASRRSASVPGFTASNPLDLYYMPYTHSLLAATGWSVVAFLVYEALRPGPGGAAAIVGLAVFSHWVLDFLVHRPDLPLYDNTAKVGLGLWNLPAVALGLEALLLFGAMWLYLRHTARRTAMLVFGVVMLAIQAYVFFGPPRPAIRRPPATALIALRRTCGGHPRAGTADRALRGSKEVTMFALAFAMGSSLSPPSPAVIPNRPHGPSRRA